MSYIHEVDAAERSRALSDYRRYVGGFAISGEAPTLVFDDNTSGEISFRDALYQAHCAKLRAQHETRNVESLRNDIRRLKAEVQHYRFGPDNPPDEDQRLITVPIGGNDSATVAYWPADREFAAVWTAWGWLQADSLSDDARDDFQNRLELVL